MKLIPVDDKSVDESIHRDKEVGKNTLGAHTYVRALGALLVQHESDEEEV